VSIAEAPVRSLLIPVQRPLPQHLGEPEPPRLPAVQDRFHDVGRQACEREQPADVGVRDQITRAKIIAAIEHRRAGGMAKSASVVDYVREAAFTILNRFVALKMLESRGLILESISRGEQSSGFGELGRLAPGLADLPDHGYQ
jgi:hypothetical protein